MKSKIRVIDVFNEKRKGKYYGVRVKAYELKYDCFMFVATPFKTIVFEGEFIDMI